MTFSMKFSMTMGLAFTFEKLTHTSPQFNFNALFLFTYWAENNGQQVAGHDGRPNIF